MQGPVVQSIISLTLLHSERPKTLWSFGCSECSRVKSDSPYLLVYIKASVLIFSLKYQINFCTLQKLITIFWQNMAVFLPTIHLKIKTSCDLIMSLVLKEEPRGPDKRGLDANSKIISVHSRKRIHDI